MDDVKPKLKEPKMVMDDWKKQVKSTKQLVMGGRVFTHYFNEAGDCIATGLGEGPYHMELFIFKFIEKQLEFKVLKDAQDEAERAEREAAKLTKAAKS